MRASSNVLTFTRFLAAVVAAAAAIAIVGRWSPCHTWMPPCARHYGCARQAHSSCSRCVDPAPTELLKHADEACSGLRSGKDAHPVAYLLTSCSSTVTPICRLCRALLSRGVSLCSPLCSPQALHDVTLPAHNVLLRRGEGLTLNMNAATRSEDNFTRARTFWPERWLIAAGKAQLPADVSAETFKHNSKVVGSFSAGPRNCPGQNLAMAAMKVRVHTADVAHYRSAMCALQRRCMWCGNMQVVKLAG
jgi:Cytochrome P450